MTDTESPGDYRRGNLSRHPDREKVAIHQIIGQTWTALNSFGLFTSEAGSIAYGG